MFFNIVKVMKLHCVVQHSGIVATMLCVIWEAIMLEFRHHLFYCHPNSQVSLLVLSPINRVACTAHTLGQVNNKHTEHWAQKQKAAQF